MAVSTPSEIITQVNALALAKEGYSVQKILVLSFMAGAYISFGALLSIMIGGGMPGIAAENPGLARFAFGAAFPLGLMLVVLCGAELFTGNNAYFIPNVLSSRQSWKAPLRNWTVVYIGNFIGALTVAYFFTHLCDVVSMNPWADSVQHIATAKTSNPFFKTFLKGIGANWLVCLALWMGLSAKSTAGKIVGIWWPVMCFVTLGYEHSIANMYFIPLALFEGSDITWASFVFDNLIPATLGNIVGGSFFVGCLYWYVSDSR